MVDLKDFQYDSKQDWYGSKFQINGISTEVYLYAEETKNIEILNDRLNNAVSWFENNYETIRDYCADNLLELYNEDWRDPEEEKITTEEFKDKLELESIAIDDDGGLEISFRDGDLFGGHWLVVYTDSEYKFDCDVEIAG